MNDAQRLARRQPALFVGGAFAVGLLGARFLKSSAQRDDDENDYTRDYSGGSYVPRTSNAYGNRVPTSSTTPSSTTRPASVTSRGLEYPPTEGL
jgi:hypothetical protein